jgi:hypothetical protein
MWLTASGQIKECERSAVENISQTDSIQKLTTDALCVWNQTERERIELTRRFSFAQKAKKEGEFDLLLQKAPASRESYEAMSKEERARMRAKVRALLGRALTSPGNITASRFFDDCELAGDSFIRQAKEFDATLSETEIHQALRNLWVFNSIQHTLGQPVGLTPSSFAYSLLYPYTDNRLDSERHSATERDAFLRWLTERLEGAKTAAFDRYSTNLARLLDMIEDEYGRSAFPEVHGSLRAIHRAQENGLSLRFRKSVEDEAALLPPTFEKGGTSVLVDGFLVRGHLTSTEAGGCFGYGVVLQLIDDLQDLDEDMAAGHSTLFSRALGFGTLDAATTRLLNYSGTMLSRFAACSPDRDKGLEDVISRSCCALVMEAVSRHGSLYSEDYRRTVEEFVPVSLSYLGEFRKRMEKRYQDTPVGSTDVRV